MDEFELKSEAMASKVELVLTIMEAAIEAVEKSGGTPDDVSENAMHMALCAQLAKLVARRMTDRNDVSTRQKCIDHTAEQLKEFVGRCFDIVDEVNKEIIARNEFSEADPSKVVDDFLSEVTRKRSSGAGTQPLQPGPDQTQKPADPPADPPKES